jgi:hypothetical protein
VIVAPASEQNPCTECATVKERVVDDLQVDHKKRAHPV